MTSLLEDQSPPRASTGMPKPAEISASVTRIRGGVMVHKITRPFVRMPGKRPAVACHDRRMPWLCTRAEGHSGRHATVLWRMGGLVRAVWGDRPDVTRARKVGAEEIATRLGERAS